MSKRGVIGQLTRLNCALSTAKDLIDIGSRQNLNIVISDECTVCVDRADVALN